jgi:hypothetical protein
MVIAQTLWASLVVAMHPFQDCLFLPLDLLGPLAGIFLAAADHVQGLKPFSTAGMLGFEGQLPDIFGTLLPFK